MFRLGRPSLLVLSTVLACEGGGDPVGPGGDDHAEDTGGTGDTTDDHGETETGGEGDCAAETRDDDFAIGLSKSGNLIRATFVSADPAPPIKGDNVWVIEIDNLSGTPLSGLDVEVIPMMPDHGHGTPIAVEITELETPGHYQLSPVNLFMTGYWQIPVDLTLAGGEEDSVMFGFCVE